MILKYHIFNNMSSDFIKFMVFIIDFLSLIWYPITIKVKSEVKIMITRLKQLRKILKINQTNFAKQLGITQTAYSMIENGNNPLSDRYIKVICSAFNVNENWLRTGNGDMFFSSPYEKEFTEVFSNLAPVTQQYLLLMAKELLNTQEKLLNPNNES